MRPPTDPADDPRDVVEHAPATDPARVGAADGAAGDANGGDEPPVARPGVLGRLRSGPGIGVAVTLGAAGLLFVAGGTTAQGTDLRNDSADLATLVAGERDQADRSTTVVESLREEVAALEAASGQATPDLDAALASMTEAAGMQPVSGPAVQVVLDDADPSSNRAQRASSPDDLVVHQQDVQAVVNALWLGGAEAMMLMDQRVVSTSAVRCVGNVLSLQGQPYSPPYVITAVGDTDAMLSALEASAGVEEYQRYVDAFGLGYEVSELEEADLPAFSGPLELRFAQVVS